MIIGLIIILQAATGFLISLYFTLVYYGILTADQRYIPDSCRMEERTCQQIIHTTEARLFGLPNSLIGLWYYLLVIISTVTPGIVPHKIMIIASASTVAVGIYLSYVLIMKLKIPCILCFTGHGINASLFTLMLFHQQ
jgi:uncharacterized membrane protein